MDESTGQPIPNREIEYGVVVRYGNGMFSSQFGGITTTDHSGRFTASGLVAGQEYVLSVVREKTSDGHSRSGRQIATVTADTTDVDMGDVLLKPAREP